MDLFGGRIADARAAALGANPGVYNIPWVIRFRSCATEFEDNAFLEDLCHCR